MKLLIVEDDKALAEGLKTILETEGYQVDAVYNGIDGCDYLTTGIYDLAILDINLPGANGFRIMDHMNTNCISTPVIFLTAKTDVEDKLRGFDSGAVDYITKPFDIRELTARIKLRINSGAERISTSYSIGNTFLDQSNFHLICNTKAIPLNKKEFLIMEQLILNTGMIQTRDSLITKVWGLDEQIEYRTLDVYISMLRKKLKHIGSAAEIITKRSVGYFIAEGELHDI